MKTYHIPVIWQSWGLLHIKAKSMEEAEELALDAPLPVGEYVDDSFEIDYEGIGVHNQKDGGSNDNKK